MYEMVAGIHTEIFAIGVWLGLVGARWCALAMASLEPSQASRSLLVLLVEWLRGLHAL